MEIVFENKEIIVELISGGLPGRAATVAVGTVRQLSAGELPTVENAGTPWNAVLNFGIPAGMPGSAWGGIGGNLTDQSDLNAVLEGKAGRIEASVSGQPADIMDAAAMPVNRLTAEIAPVQDLHGFDRPWAAGKGRNLIDPAVYPAYNRNGIDIYEAADNVLRVTGTAEAQVNYTVTHGSVARKADAPIHLPAGVYTFSVRKADGTKVSFGGSMALYYWYAGDGDEDRKVISATTQTYISVTLNAAEEVYITPGFAITSGTATNADVYLQLEADSSASAWSPFANVCPIGGRSEMILSHSGADTDDTETIRIAWPDAGTVYGGVLDVTGGTLTVTDGCIAAYAGEPLPGVWISDRDAYAEGGSPSAGAQVVYKLADPLVYQQQTRQLRLRQGENHVRTDCGAVRLDYTADTKMYIDGSLAALRAEILEMISGN